MKSHRLFGGVLALLLPAVAVAAAPCSCDCNGDRSVRIHEITTGVNIALDHLSLDRCAASDADGDGVVGVADLVGGVDAALGACPADPTPTPTPGDALLLLRENRQRWESMAPDRYVYRLERYCFCLPPNAVDVHVVGGSVVAILDATTGEPVPPPAASWFPSIAEMFDLIETELTGGRGTQRVVYDPFWGIPIEVDIDFEVAAVDDELSLRVSNLRPETDGGCRTSPDCDVIGGLCVEPGGFVGCGICLDIPDECAFDGDCEGEAICGPLGREACSSCDGMPILACQPGCSSDDDCETGSACGENHHCSPVRCLGDEACPPLFACLLPPDSRTGECRRRACAGDPNCGDGYCVKGACYEELGRCQLPPP